MNSKIIEYHQFLNNIYKEAESYRKQLVSLSYEVNLNSYNRHYIKIDGKYEEQLYFMPVISIGNKGDICFNLDGITFEFYIEKEDLLKLETMDEILKQYGSVINIYEFEDCTVDVYTEGDSIEILFDKVKQSKDSRFGISIDCSQFKKEIIITHFDKIYLLLKNKN